MTIQMMYDDKIEEGRRKERIDIILEMFNNSVPLEMIAKFTKITLKEVESIIADSRSK